MTLTLHDPDLRSPEAQPPSHRGPRKRRIRTVIGIAAAIPLVATVAVAATFVTSPSKGDANLTSTLASAPKKAAPAAPSSPSASSAATATSTPSAKSAAAPAAAGGSAAAVATDASDAGCTVSANLVPSCGAWWGVSPNGHRDQFQGVKAFEQMTGAKTDMYRGYHDLGDMFPTAEERAIANDPAGKRILLLSLKPTDRTTTWADVAAGKQDAYLDRLSAYIKANYRDKFIFVIHHEPENDVRASAGSGMTATDFRDMFRHIAQRLDSQGATNALTAIVYQGAMNYKLEPWWASMYPGDDVVDWIGWDSYSCVKPTDGEPCRDFGRTMNIRYTENTPWQGMYAWATANHPGKPIVIAELGIYSMGDGRKAQFFNNATSLAPLYPAVKAIAYWNNDGGGEKKASLDDQPKVIAAASKFAKSAMFRQSVP